MYYLQSRYYDPTIGRFINADAIVSSGQGFLGYNMFAYCRNHPVDRVDTAGYTDEKVLDDGTVDMDPTDDQPQGGGVTGGGSSDGQIFSGGIGSSLPGIQQRLGGEISSSQSSGTPIYRFGYTSVEKLVPTPEDVKQQHKFGLSFSTRYRTGAAKTTIEAVNATGILYAVKDSKNHVSIYPVGATLADWLAAGVDSIWTQTLVELIDLT